MIYWQFLRRPKLSLNRDCAVTHKLTTYCFLDWLKFMRIAGESRKSQIFLSFLKMKRKIEWQFVFFSKAYPFYIEGLCWKGIEPKSSKQFVYILINSRSNLLSRFGLMDDILSHSDLKQPARLCHLFKRMPLHKSFGPVV